MNARTVIAIRYAKQRLESAGLLYARRKPAAGQGSLMFNEEDHPRAAKGTEHGGQFVAKDSADAGVHEPFTLANPTAKPKGVTFENNTGRQKTLLSGLDAMPGQMDLLPDMDVEANGPAESVWQAISKATELLHDFGLMKPEGIGPGDEAPVDDSTDDSDIPEGLQSPAQPSKNQNVLGDTRIASDGTIWKPAKAGGEKSPVNGNHYKGGQWMPIHGLTPPKQPKEKKPAPATPQPEIEGMRRRQPPPQRTPEELAAIRERAERERKWSEIHQGPLGYVLGLAPREHPIRGGHGIAKKWMEHAEKVGDAPLKAAAEFAKQKAIELVGKDIDARPWQLKTTDGRELTREEAIERYLEHQDAMRMPPEYGGITKKHQKTNPSTGLARSWVETMLHERGGENIDLLHQLNRILAGEPHAQRYSKTGTPPHSAVGIVHHDGHYLLGLGRNTGDWRTGKWVHSGGHIKPGESPTAAAIREVREETGIVCRPRGEPFEHPSAPGVAFVPLVAVAPQRGIANHEFHAVHWLRPEHLPHLKSGHNTAALIDAAQGADA